MKTLLLTSFLFATNVFAQHRCDIYNQALLYLDSVNAKAKRYSIPAGGIDPVNPDTAQQPEKITGIIRYHYFIVNTLDKIYPSSLRKDGYISKDRMRGKYAIGDAYQVDSTGVQGCVLDSIFRPTLVKEGLVQRFTDAYYFDVPSHNDTIHYEPARVTFSHILKTPEHLFLNVHLMRGTGGSMYSSITFVYMHNKKHQWILKDVFSEVSCN